MESLSKFKSGSTRVMIASEPITYTDLSDIRVAVLKSNVEESVTKYTFPDASVGSLYSAVITSPCLSATALILSVALSVNSYSNTPDDASVSVSTKSHLRHALEAVPL